MYSYILYIAVLFYHTKVFKKFQSYNNINNFLSDLSNIAHYIYLSKIIENICFILTRTFLQ